MTPRSAGVGSGLDVVNARKMSDRCGSTAREQVCGFLVLADGTNPDFLAVAIESDSFFRISS